MEKLFKANNSRAIHYLFQMFQCTQDYANKVRNNLSRLERKETSSITSTNRLVTDGSTSRSNTLVVDGSLSEETSKIPGKRLSSYSRSLIKELNKWYVSNYLLWSFSIYSIGMIPKY